MPERIIYPTELPSLELRELELDDADAFFDAVDASREHLSQFGDITADNYPNVKAVAQSIDWPVYKHETGLRLGIWNNDTFVGSISLHPLQDHYEVGYWLDQRHTGHGYATIALRALAAHAPRYTELFAAINAHNLASKEVAIRAGFALDSSDGDIEYFSYRTPPVSPQQEPVLFAQTLYQDNIRSKARIGLRGLNAATINHESTTMYEVILGNGLMNIDGTDRPLFEGVRLTVPAGTPYQDEGHLVMLATSEPPFNPASVEMLGYDLL